MWCCIVQVCEGTTSNDDVQEVNGEILAYTEDENDGVEIIAAEIEDELEEAIADIAEEHTDIGGYGITSRVCLIEVYGKTLKRPVLNIIIMLFKDGPSNFNKGVNLISRSW